MFWVASEIILSAESRRRKKVFLPQAASNCQNHSFHPKSGWQFVTHVGVEPSNIVFEYCYSFSYKVFEKDANYKSSTLS
jgi:hypothetical protein